MSQLPNSFIQNLKAASPIVEIAADYYELEDFHSGIKRAKCKHGETEPSLTFWPDTNTFYCYGCHAGTKDVTGSSDPIAFIMWMEECTWYEAMTKLANRAEMAIPNSELTPEDKANLALYDKAESQCRDFEKALARDTKTQSFFKERGFSDQDFKTWRLGSHNGKPVYSIQNEQGRICGFAYRDGGEIKYKNSKTTPIFHKGELLYGLIQAQPNLRREKYLVLVEGYNDAIMLNKYGVPAVALMGTSMSEAQVRLIRRYAKRVILFLDGDRAGIQTTLRHAVRLIKEKIVVRVVNILGMDPDEIAIAKQDLTGSFLQQNSLNALAYILSVHTQRYETVLMEESIRLMEEFEKLIEVIEDENIKLLLREKLKGNFYVRHFDRAFDPNASQQGSIRKDFGSGGEIPFALYQGLDSIPGPA